MATITALLAAHLPAVVAACVAAFIAWLNRDKVKAWYQGKKDDDGMEAVDGLDISAFLNLFKDLGSDLKAKKEAISRALVLASLVRIETKLEELSLSESDKTAGRESIKQLGSLFMVPTPNPNPVVTKV